jgi:hypothetical protein
VLDRFGQRVGVLEWLRSMSEFCQNGMPLAIIYDDLGAMIAI